MHVTDAETQLDAASTSAGGLSTMGDVLLTHYTEYVDEYSPDNAEVIQGPASNISQPTVESSQDYQQSLKPECLDDGSSAIDADAPIEDPPGLTDDTGSLYSVSTASSTRARRLPSMDLLRSVLLYKGASPHRRPYKLPVHCALCNEALGTGLKEMRSHLDRHATSLSSDFVCQICQVRFTHQKDLELHRISAENGFCGFDFEHAESCTGHHPPDVFSEMLTDNDRLQFSLRLQHWEQAQLRAYLQQVNALAESLATARDGDCWSIDALRNSLDSLSSALGQRKPRSDLDVGDSSQRMESSQAHGTLTVVQRKQKTNDLATAASRGDTDRARRLLSEGADVNGIHRLSPLFKGLPLSPLTPLEHAIEGGHIQMIELLIEHGVEVNKTRRNVSPLFRAVRKRNLSVLLCLLSHGAFVNQQLKSKTALSLAVYQGDRETVQMLIGFGGDVNTESDAGSLSTIAAKCGDAEMFRVLQDYGANPPAGLYHFSYIIESHFGTVWKVNAEIASLLENRYAEEVDPIQRNRRELYAAFQCSPLAISSIVTRFSLGNHELSGFGNILHYAACHGHRQVVEALLAKGADIDADSGRLGRPLAWAISQDHGEIVSILLRRGAKHDGWSGPFASALECATVYNRPQIGIMLVLDFGVAANSLSVKYRRRCEDMLDRYRSALMMETSLAQTTNKLVSKWPKKVSS